ncbi:hypothetical protein KW801_01250 [Candidatus Saccharibacteria bacterium]|nr:hypothetical protein [Candidatus Saccharibacteria bacterium]
MNLKRLKSYVLAEMLFAVLMIGIGCAIPLIIRNNPELKHRDLLYALEVLATGGLVLQLGIYILNTSRKPLRLYLLVSLLATALGLMAAW